MVIVEDDPLLMRLYQEAFEKRGYAPQVYFDGVEAYRALSEMPEKPTLVLSDVMMPKMNGLELLEKMRGSADLRNILFVLSTNLSEKKYAEKGLALGAAAYLVKGEYAVKEFVDKIDELVAASKEQAVPETQVPIRDTNDTSGTQLPTG